MIETERRVLLQPRSQVIEPFCKMWANPEVTQHIAPQPLTRRQAWMNFLYLAGHWDLLGYGGWIIHEKDNGAFVGMVGYQQFVRGIDATREHLPELGWVLSPAAWGRGYAREAAIAALAWGDVNLPAATTVAIVSEPNAGSLRLAAKINFIEITRVAYSGFQMIMLERARVHQS